MRTVITVVCVAALAAGAAFGQHVISAKSGMIHYVEGTVLLDGKQVEPKFAEYPQIGEKSVLASTEGRAEVLLGPGVFLRIGENSEIVLLSDRITDTRLGLKRGSAVLDILELPDGNQVTLLTGNAAISFQEAGVYRIDAIPGRLLVYDGEASVAQNDQVQRVKKSRMLLLNGVAVAEKFDNRTGDSLMRWAKRRDESIAMANISAAKISAAKYPGGGRYSNGWVWNPWFGMFTYVPYNGMFNNFWGYRFWSPGAVYAAYYVPRPWPGVSAADTGGGWHSAGGGYNSMPASSSGSSGVVTSTATAGASNTSAPAASSGHPGGVGGGGRGR